MPSPDLENVSTALIEIEHEEIPPSYRLLYDAPILSSYQFTARPFAASLNLKPYTQSITVGQVVDYAQLSTRISAKGEVFTDVQYLLKSKGTTNLQLHLLKRHASGTRRWMVVRCSISGKGCHLTSLPQNADPNSLITIDLKLATAGSEVLEKDAATTELRVLAPSLEAPVLLGLELRSR